MHVWWFISLLLQLITACTSDLDCFLNGECDLSRKTCSCFPPWTASDCGLLRFKAVPPIQGYGMRPNLTAWGGNAILGDDGLYHLFVAEMVNGCPLRTWSKNSQCSHATSNTTQGPYLYRDTAVGVWCHNPQVVQLSDRTYALFHIGTGTGGTPENCTSPASTASASVVAEGSTIHIAATLNGPWQPLDHNTLPDCNNPAPLARSDGTLLIVCNGMDIFSASNIRGPWKSVGHVDTKGGPVGSYEDPVLYNDARGGYHVLYHVYNTQEPRDTCVNSTVSAHCASVNLVDWRCAHYQPYTTQILHTTGETITVSTRERPKLGMDSQGREQWLFTAVCSAPACPSGPPTGCVDCKYDSWDYWLAQELDLT